MKKYVHIILLSDVWDSYHRKEFLLSMSKKLSFWSDVIIVELPVSLFVHPFTNFIKYCRNIFKVFKPLKEKNEYSVFTPLILFHYLLWPKSNFFFGIDYHLFNYQIKKIIKKKFGSRKIILWLFFPYLLKLAIRYKEKNEIILYDQYDLHNYDINGNENEKITRLNKELIKFCDFVFCTTKYIYDLSKKINTNSYYITNGNNFTLLQKKVIKNIEKNKKDKKIVGYIGGIRNWLDFELLRYIAVNLKNVDFVFIGKIYDDSDRYIKELCKNENVKWHNYIPHEKLIDYLNKFDVGIIPFKKSTFFKGVFPNKFYEYMAAGIPIVTTPLPELLQYKDIICVAKNEKEFLEHINSILNGNYSKFVNTYVELAKKNAWEAKAEQWNEILRDYLIKGKNNITN